MRLTEGLLKKICRLLQGEALSASTLKGDWIDALVGEGILKMEFNGSRGRCRISDRDAFLSALADIDERFRTPDFLYGDRESLASDRGTQAANTGNSKIVRSRGCPGFPVNSYEPIVCRLNGHEYVVAPEPGTFLFISDWRSFEVPADIVVIGVENMENFRLIREQRPFLDSLVEGKQILFVSRFPQSKDLREWLVSIPNRYIHFGDFDLAGVQIYEKEFAMYLRNGAEGRERCSMFIPSDIEERLRFGVRVRYDDQLAECQAITSPDAAVCQLLALIRKYRRGYDQEGYIHRHPAP